MSRKGPTKYQKAFEEIDFITNLRTEKGNLYIDQDFNEELHYIIDNDGETDSWGITKEDIKQRKGYKDYFDVSDKSVRNRVNKLLRDSKEIDEIMEFLINISDENPKNNLVTVSPVIYDYEEDIIFGSLNPYGYEGLMVKLLKKLVKAVDEKPNSHDFKSLKKQLEKVEKKFVSSIGNKTYKTISQKEHEEYIDVINRSIDDPSIDIYDDDIYKEHYEWKNYQAIMYRIQLVLNKIKEKEKQRKALDAIFKKNKSVPDEMRNEIEKFMGGKRTRKHKNSNKKNSRKNKK
jgi:hypothetical protein